MSDLPALGEPAIRAFARGTRPDGREVVLDQLADPAPQVMSLLESAACTAARVRFALLDGEGAYHGEGLAEAHRWGSGALFYALGLRLVGGRTLKSAREVGVELALGELALPGTVDASAGEAELGAPDTPLRLAWTTSDAMIEPHGGEGRFPPLGDGRAPPFYELWEPHFLQWGGAAPWRSVDVARGALRFLWIEEEEALAGERVLLGAIAIGAPAIGTAPTVTGGRLRYYSHLDGAWHVRATSDRVVVRFPERADARVVLESLEPGTSVRALADGRDASCALATHGGRTDDPYGTGPARPDDWAGEVRVPDAARGPVEAYACAGGAREVVLRASPGLAAAYAKLDGRRLLSVTAPDATKPVATVSLRELKLRELVRPGETEAGLAMLPLHWLTMNAPAREDSLNVLERFEIEENGPEIVSLALAARNPSGGAACLGRYRLRLVRGSVLVEAKTRLELRTGWDRDQIQFANIFPVRSGQPDDWRVAETLAMDGEGRSWCADVRAPRGEAHTLQAGKMVAFTPPFFLAQYAAPRGNLLALVKSVEPAGSATQYMLCPSWLDNHFHVRFAAPPEPGAAFTVEYEVALYGDASLTREDALALGERSLAAGRLVLAGG